MFALDVVDRIFLILEQKKIEQKQFAAAVGVAPSKVTQWKNKSSMSYLKRMSKIADFLGTSVEYLINGDEKKEPTTENGDGPSDFDTKLRGIMETLDEDDLELLLAQAELMAKRKQKQ